MMVRVGRGWLAAAALGVMAGCSESSDGGVSYDDLTDQFDGILEGGADLPFTDPASLPVSGSATYDGVMGLSTDGSEGIPLDMAGEMTLRADFGNDSLSGSVTEFETSANRSLDGSLDVSGGQIDRDADLEETYTYDFDLDGTLTTGDGTDLDVTAVGSGDFLGEGYRQATGIVDGVVSSDTGTSLLQGGFAVER